MKFNNNNFVNYKRQIKYNNLKILINLINPIFFKYFYNINKI